MHELQKNGGHETAYVRKTFMLCWLVHHALANQRQDVAFSVNHVQIENQSRLASCDFSLAFRGLHEFCSVVGCGDKFYD